MLIFYQIKRFLYRRNITNLIKKGLKFGKDIHIKDGVYIDPSHCFLISIGDNTTLAGNVRLIAHDASTKRFLGYTKIGKINIKENCFIGSAAVILPGVTIGPNSIIGAGSIVTKNVPPYKIAAGNPAKVISSVEEYIRKIENISKNKKIFGKEYYIDRLDEAKRQEIIQSIGETIGFIY